MQLGKDRKSESAGMIKHGRANDHEYVAFHLDTIKKVLDKLPDVAPDAETIYYIYSYNENKIKGLSLRDLI